MTRLSLSLKRAWRLQRGSGASVLIVIALAVTLGAATAVLTIADALLFRAVPFDDPSRLARITSGFTRMPARGIGLSGPETLELAEITTAFAAVGPLTFSTPAIEEGASPVPADSVEISQAALAALGLRPVLGRAFAPADFAPGGAPVTMISEALWWRAYGGDPAAIGRILVIDGVRHQIAGVIGRDIALLGRRPDVWRPLALDRATAGSRAEHRYTVIGRVRAGLTLDDAAADVGRAVGIWLEEFGEPHSPSSQHPLTVESLASATTGVRREPVTALIAAAVFLLLIACANVSLLLAARAEQRRGDVAVQWALGARMGALAIDALVEGALLSFAGGVLGIAVATALLGAMQAAWPVLAELPLDVDVEMLGVATLLTSVAALLTGLLPVLRLRGARVARWLRAGGRGQSGDRQRTQRVVVALQIALALTLWFTAGLLVRSLAALGSVDTGFTAEGVLHARVTLPDAVFVHDAQVFQLYDDVLTRLRRMPGVTRAAAMSGLPPLRRANNSSFLLDGVTRVDHASIKQADFIQHVTPDYFETLDIPMVQGRAFAETDDARGARVAIVNQTLADRFWPGESPIGHTLSAAGFQSWFTVVGVAADVRQDGLARPAGAELYVPHRQARALVSSWMPSSLHIVARVSGSQAPASAALGDLVRDAHPSAAVSDITSMDAVVARTIAEPRVLAWVLGAFAAVGLVVACAGVFAVTSYGVGARAGEFGLRMALGATPRDVLMLVLRSGVLQVVPGLVLGAAGAVASGRLVEGLLFHTAALDLVSIAGASASIAVAALLATLLPAARAARVDPLIALRDI